MTIGISAELINKINEWGRKNEVDLRAEGINLHQKLAKLTLDYWHGELTEEYSRECLGELLLITIISAQKLDIDLGEALNKIVKEKE